MSLNILLVDDSETVRAVISKALNIAGLPIGQLYEAANGKEALELLKREWIDLVLADIHMPVMGGVELIERMCEDGLMNTIPVIVISTEGSKTRIEQLMSKGVRAYLRKPFSPETIRDVVEDITGVQHGS